MVLLMATALGLTSLRVAERNARRALQAGCASGLQQIGMALEIYSRNHNDFLPGPVFPVARAGYDETAPQELAWHLAESLGYPKPSKCVNLVPALICPKYQHCGDTQGQLANRRSYVLNGNLGRRDSARASPFGSPTDPACGPLKLSSVAVYGAPSSIPAMSDADKANVNPKLSCWQDLPCRPAHGRTRTRLFFDGHVELDSW